MNKEKLNDMWDIKNLIQMAVEKAHSSPSPETKERLAILTTNQKDITEKMDKIVIDTTEIKTHIKYIKEKFENLPCSNQDKRIIRLEEYKNKQIGMIAMVGIIAGVMGWVLSPFINWLFKKI